MPVLLSFTSLFGKAFLYTQLGMVSDATAKEKRRRTDGELGDREIADTS